MRFGVQQVILISVGLVGANLPRISEILGNNDTPIEPTFALTWIFVFLLNLAIFRYFFWLAWSSERGDRFFRTIGLPKHRVLSGFGSGFLRWFCHIDENGIDLDANRV